MYATHMGSLPPPSVRKLTPPSRSIMLIPATAAGNGVSSPIPCATGKHVHFLHLISTVATTATAAHASTAPSTRHGTWHAAARAAATVSRHDAALHAPWFDGICTSRQLDRHVSHAQEHQVGGDEWSA